MAKKKKSSKPTQQEVSRVVEDARQGIMPGPGKVTEKNKNAGLVDVETIDKHMDDVLKNSKDWENRAQPSKAYEYYETNQIPERMESAKDMFYVQLNLIRDSHDTRMGLFAASPIDWKISGSGSDKKDRDRIDLHTHLCKWAANEIGLMEQIRRAIFDFVLHGMGWLRILYDYYYLTSIGTMGMVRAKKLEALKTHPSIRSRDGDALDGQYLINFDRMTEGEFIEDYDGRILPNGKQADAKKIFAEIEDSDHFDYRLNEELQGDEKLITVIDYEYKRYRKLQYELGGDTINIPLREFRQAYAAGKTKLADKPSGIDKLQHWSKILISNEPMHNSCYSSSQFPAEKELQDLINIMLSMSVGNQAGQINSPWKAVAGSLVDEASWESSASAFKGILKWRYTKAMKEQGIPPAAAEPKRDRPGQFDPGWFALMQWVFQKFDSVSVKDVIKGVNQPGVQSGKHAAILSAQGLQPTIYQREKIEMPFKRIGNAIHHYLVTKLEGEMEIPIEEADVEEDGVVVNHILNMKELGEMIQGKDEIKESLNMCSVAVNVNGKTERHGCEEFMDQGGISYTDLIAGAVNGAYDIVKNDIKFGDFRAALVIDPRAEATKIERMARADQVSGMLMNMGAGMSALKYTLESHEDPNAKQIIDDVMKEVKGLRLGQNLLDIAEKAKEVVAQQGGDPSQLPKSIQMLLNMANQLDEEE